jgi:hypothetical protein
MSDSVQEQLIGYLLGALDEAEAEAVQQRLAVDPQYREQYVQLRRQLERLEVVLTEPQPPPGLAERTCRLVFQHADAQRVRALARRPISPQAAPPSRTTRSSWLDMVVAACVLAAVGLGILPAVQNSRFQARLASCQDNLRQLGFSLSAYSMTNQGYFPRVPAQGKLAAGGVYAPTLQNGGFLTDGRRVICPDSALVAERDFRIPSLDEIRAAGAGDLTRLRSEMGGSYGYCIGYLDNGVFQATRNFSRPRFALMADAPTPDLPNHQSLNHGGLGQNVLFEDGHVAFLTSSKPCDLGDDIFANDAQVVAVGLHRDDSVIVGSGTPPLLSLKTFPTQRP